MKPGSKKWKLFMAKLYGIGAAIVIVGAMFKIEHWPGASLMLTVGLSIEAVIFFFSAFEKPHEDPDWSLVYPELKSGVAREAAPSIGGGSSLSQQLDSMLVEAKVEPELIASLGDGLRSFSTQAGQLSDMTDASVASNEYAESLKTASSKVNNLADTYERASNSITGLTEDMESGATAGEHLAKMTENLSTLNSAYQSQISELESTRNLYSGINEMITNLSDSIEDTKQYKENISELAKNLAALNTVYGNMLNAMNVRVGE